MCSKNTVLVFPICRIGPRLFLLLKCLFSLFLLTGALQITLEGVYHSPLGAEEGSDDSSSSSEVGAALAAGNLESSSNSTMTDLDAYNDDDVSLKEVEEAAAAAVASGPGPRLWYGSKSVLQQWVRFIHSSS